MDKTPIQWMITPLQCYVDFSGRSRRAEYWWFNLFFVLMFIPAVLIDTFVLDQETGPAQILLVIALLLPGLAVTVRRFHDQDKSGWYILLSFLPFVGTFVQIWFMTRPGTPGRNRFGDDPLPHSNLAEDFA
jgi:uncharacterized membrane protein YhaH (DUF805 family)